MTFRRKEKDHHQPSPSTTRRIIEETTRIMKAVVFPPKEETHSIQDPERKILQRSASYPVNSVNSALDQANIPLEAKTRRSFEDQIKGHQEFKLTTIQGLIRSTAFEENIAENIDKTTQNLIQEQNTLKKYGLLTPQRKNEYSQHIAAHTAGAFFTYNFWYF